MTPLTEPEIRAAFVNTSKREAAQASMPDLDTLRWDRLDLLGWVDAKRPSLAYVVLELDRGPTAILLRPAKAADRRPKAMCAWCQDIIAVDDVTFYAAPRAGAAGRQGNTIGTLICTDFRCSTNVRRLPTISEAGSEDPAARAIVTERRITGLRERSRQFVTHVLTQA